MPRTDLTLHGHPAAHSIAYGLDNLPYPGYFLSVEGHTIDPETGCRQLTHGWDTRPHMALGAEIVCPCNRHTIADELERFLAFLTPEDRRTLSRDIDFIRGDLPVGNTT